MTIRVSTLCKCTPFVRPNIIWNAPTDGLMICQFCCSDKLTTSTASTTGGKHFRQLTLHSVLTIREGWFSFWYTYNYICQIKMSQNQSMFQNVDKCIIAILFVLKIKKLFKFWVLKCFVHTFTLSLCIIWLISQLCSLLHWNEAIHRLCPWHRSVKWKCL